MSLYSHNLSGLVVLTDCNLDEDSPRDTTEKVSDICSRSTEYHFPSFDQQLESLKLKTGAPNNKLKCGDFYMTRHSNLCEVHVLFHIKEEFVEELSLLHCLCSCLPLLVDWNFWCWWGQVLCQCCLCDVPVLLQHSHLFHQVF